LEGEYDGVISSIKVVSSTNYHFFTDTFSGNV